MGAQLPLRLQQGLKRWEGKKNESTDNEHKLAHEYINEQRVPTYIFNSESFSR